MQGFSLGATMNPSDVEPQRGGEKPYARYPTANEGRSSLTPVMISVGSAQVRGCKGGLLRPPEVLYQLRYKY